MLRRRSSCSSHVIFEKKNSSILNLLPLPENSCQLCAFSVSSGTRGISTTAATIFDIESGKQIANYSSPTDFRSPITSVSVLESNGIITGMEDGSVRAYSTITPKKEPIWEIHCDGVVRCTALSTNSDETLLACGVQFADCSKSKEKDSDSEEDGSEYGLVFYDLRSNPPSLLGAYKESHSDVVNCLRFDSSDGDALYSGGNDSLVNIFDLKQSTEEDALQYTFSCVSPLSRIGCWILDDKSCLYALTEDHRLYSWLTENGDDVFSIENRDDLFSKMENEDLFIVDCFQKVEASENSLLMVASSPEGRLAISRISNGQKKGVTLLHDYDIGHRDMIRCLVYDNKSSLLYTGGDDGMIVCSDMETFLEEEPSKKRKKVK